MKNLIYVIAMLLFVGFSTQQTSAQKKENKVVCFKSNMDCANCESTLNEHLKFEKGVKNLKVDYLTNTIKVEYKDGKNTTQGLSDAIKKKGYVAKEISQEEYKKIVEVASKQKHKPESLH